MIELQDGKKIYIEETEKKPNKYASNVLLGVVIVITIVCVLNEMSVFTLNKLTVRVCFFVTLLLFVLLQFLIRVPRLLVAPRTKYIIMGIMLFLMLTITTLLNIHAILAYMLPILLAVQYRSRSMSLMALIGSVLCAAIAPIISYFLNTWNIGFMTGYMETFCKVSVTITEGTDTPVGDAIWMIILYWAMPQMLTLLAFGMFLFSATNSSIANVKRQIRIVDLSKDLNTHLQSIISMQEKMVYAMSDIIESRDIETGGHVRRTSEVVRMLIDRMKHDPSLCMTEEYCSEIIKSAPMHDLGKISIPDAILRKPGRLTSEEYEIVKKHPEKSADIIEMVLSGIEDESLMNTAKNIAMYHHERVDGTGYPMHLVGKAIPLEARIMAIADVYDALVSERCYKASMSLPDAFAVIEESMGTQFDMDLNKYFIDCRADIERFYSEK